MDSSNDPASRIQALKHPVWIGYGRVVAIRQQMEELFNHPRMHRMPNLAVIGESNNGKSMLLNNFVRRHDPTHAPGYSVNDDKIERPVFLFQAPPEPDETLDPPHPRRRERRNGQFPHPEWRRPPRWRQEP